MWSQGGDEAAGSEVPDLAAIKARVREMEEEAEKLKQMQTEVDKQMNMGSPPGLSEFNIFLSQIQWLLHIIMSIYGP